MLMKSSPGPGHTPPSPTSLRHPLTPPFLSHMPSPEAQHFLLLLGSCWALLPRCPPAPQCLPPFSCLSLPLFLCLCSHPLLLPHSISQPVLLSSSQLPRPYTSFYTLLRSSALPWPKICLEPGLGSSQTSLGPLVAKKGLRRRSALSPRPQP